MPIFAASSGIVMPGCPWTNENAWSALVPLPLRRPARRRAFGRAGFRVVFADAGAVRVRLTDPRGRPGPRRRGALVAAPAADDPPTPARAEAAASRRLNSS